jgi:hypothetical protein
MVVLLAMTERRGTQDKQLTVSDAVAVGVSSDIATLTVNGSDCTGDNRSIFVLREDKELLNCAEIEWFIGRKGWGIWCVVLSAGNLFSFSSHFQQKI